MPILAHSALYPQRSLIVPNANPRLSRVLQIVNIIQCAVLIIAAVGLFALQNVAGPNWPWETTPFNMAFLGAIYLTSFVTILPAALSNRWSPTRPVLIKVFTFAMLALLVSVLYASSFRPLWSK